MRDREDGLLAHGRVPGLSIWRTSRSYRVPALDRIGLHQHRFDSGSAVPDAAMPALTVIIPAAGTKFSSGNVP